MIYFLTAILAYFLPSHADETRILAFAGSTSSSSINKQLVEQAAQAARELGAKVKVIDLKDYPIPFYDADLEIAEGLPKNAKQIRDLMIQSDAIIIASPEYNGSVPAVLKNLIDWLSRGEEGGLSKDAFDGKRFAIMSASPGKLGGARGLIHLQNILENLGGEIALKKVSVPNAYENGVFETKELKTRLHETIELILK